MTRTRSHIEAIGEVRKELRKFDTVAGFAIDEQQHIRAMGADVNALRTSLSDGVGQPLERWRLARIAAHAIALMSETDE